ncbi:peptidase S8 [Virgibacillus phasianinus]|uniref:Peptidase S8 n=2 Tax=Virgibacillus phasianinus TaxID=2017483 RepID=A0A220U8D3_9BACI|nr:peptidase S8 [Virgibacillus phasianinus]
MIFSLLTPGLANAETKGKLYHSVKDSQAVAKEKMSDRLLESFKKDEKETFLIKFKENTETKKIAKEARKTAESANVTAQKAEVIQRSAVVSELKATSLTSQQGVKQYLEKEAERGNVKNIRSYYIVNGMAVTATKEIAEKVASFAEVEKILPNETRQLFTTKTKDAKTPKSEVANVEWNVNRVGAPQVWGMGFDGSGTVIASIDTGVQWDHPALKEKYRGYDAATGEVNHDYSWFDATAGEPEPYDDLGHGTHTIGTMVGSEPDGSNQVGVAPGAKFISVKAFTAAGGTDADLLAAAEWIMAPTDSEGNARVDMAPDVVNNSWGGGPGLNEWYRDVVKNWRAAGIFPEFSAGNTTLTNPGGPGSVANPANYPESFATGATNSDDVVAGFSLRGPSPYDEIKPDISAPGVNIRSSVPGSGYEGGWNGTSMAGPAVAGVVALLHQVDASLTVDELEEILLNTATPLTDDEYPESPNNGYGYGLVNAYAAVNSIVNGLGTLKGQVTKQGEDSEAPAFEHTAPAETYSGMDLDLTVQVTDNISVLSVDLKYKDLNGEWQTVEATRTSGDYKNGEYTATIPGEQIDGDSLTYKWTISDFGDNEVNSEEYTVTVLEGISTGYTEDFEATPVGWTSFGDNNNWEWGVPTSGPGSAASGEKVYATNLDGDYESSQNATLVMPPIDLPEGDAYLQFKQWYDLEKYESGSAYDFGHVFVSTDREEWVQLMEMSGTTTDWESAEVDLSEYSGQRIYIGFNVTSDSSVTEQGLYIDDVALSNTSISSKISLEKKDKKAKDKRKNGLHNNKNKKAKNGLGVIKSNEKAGLKKKVDPDKIQPKLPKKDNPPAHEDVINPTLLPIGAQVSVLESGRSVMTNPEDGTYSLTHAAGEFTVQASTYGFESEQQTVTIEKDGTTEANFTLDEIPEATVSGTITDEKTGEPIEGATLFLTEDANIAPVESDENGNYSLTAYEGTYTLKVIASDYNSKEVEVTIEEDQELNIELEPLYTYPGGEIGYDDGTAENARAFYDAGNGWAVKMSLPEGKESALVTDGVFKFWNEEFPNPGGTEFAVEVWDASGTDGLPGKKIAGPINAEAIRDETAWTVIDLSEHNIMVDGDFYMVYIQTDPNPVTPALATDESSPNAERSYQLVGGAWSQSPANEGNYMIRARVSYEVDAPVITSPGEDTITNEPNITVEGTASPTTTVQLVNNEEEIGTAEVGDDGKFAISTELTEGENVLKAVSLLDGAQTGESAPVAVTLDTEAPAITIDSPQDGDKTNRETVTVEGTVSDANLDFVEVNGRKAEVSDGSYSKRILLDNGENEIEVVAQDSAGNMGSESVTIDVKYNAPVLENVTPTEDKNLQTGQSVKIEFDSEPGLKGTFFVHMPLTNMSVQIANATELPMMEMSDGHYVGYWTVPSGVKADGAVIEVKAVDSFKNETRELAEGKLFINLDEE